MILQYDAEIYIKIVFEKQGTTHIMRIMGYNTKYVGKWE